MVYKWYNSKDYLWAACVEPKNRYTQPRTYAWSRYDKATGTWPAHTEPSPEIGEDHVVPEPTPESSAFVENGTRWIVRKDKKGDGYLSLIKEEEESGEIFVKHKLKVPVTPHYLCVKIDGSPEYIWAGFKSVHLSIMRLDKNTGEIIYYTADEKKGGLYSHGVTDLVIDGKYVWVSSDSYGVQRLNIPLGKWEHFLY